MILLMRNPEWWCDHREDMRSALQDAAIAEPHVESDAELWLEPPAAFADSDDVVEIPTFWPSRIDDLVRGIPRTYWNMREEGRPNSEFGMWLHVTIDHQSRQWERDREWEREHEHDRDDLDVGR